MQVTKIILRPEFVRTLSKGDILRGKVQEREYVKSSLNYYAHAVWNFPGVSHESLSGIIRNHIKQIKALGKEIRQLTKRPKRVLTLFD